jgi:hypothetical protein
MAVPIPKETQLSSFGFTFGTLYVGIEICMLTTFKLSQLYVFIFVILGMLEHST